MPTCGNGGQCSLVFTLTASPYRYLEDVEGTSGHHTSAADVATPSEMGGGRPFGALETTPGAASTSSGITTSLWPANTPLAPPPFPDATESKT
eukprot:43053-Eustigmatos_ZCMA.PRE.1